MFELQELFPQTYFTHTTTCAYLPLFIGYWNMRKYSDSNIFWASDFCGDFPPGPFGVFEK